MNPQPAQIGRVTPTFEFRGLRNSRVFFASRMGWGFSGRKPANDRG